MTGKPTPRPDPRPFPITHLRHPTSVLARRCGDGLCVEEFDLYLRAGLGPSPHGDRRGGERGLFLWLLRGFVVEGLIWGRDSGGFGLRQVLAMLGQDLGIFGIGSEIGVIPRIVVFV